MKFNTNVINFFGPPGTGKSTTAAGTFHLMKLMGLNVELVTEFAKDMVWAGRKQEMANQCYITAKQFHKMHRVVGQVDWIVTDSPLLLGLIYREDGYSKYYDNFLSEQFNAFENINVLLNRVKPYNPKGRLQTEVESDDMKQIFDLLLKGHTPYDEVLQIDADEKAPKKVIEYLISEYI